jgi:hypothetical protein
MADLQGFTCTCHMAREMARMAGLPEEGLQPPPAAYPRRPTDPVGDPSVLYQCGHPVLGCHDHNGLREREHQ